MRRIAILTDVHALLEPLEAVLDDINKKGIKEIYSLGDVVGLGPNPKEVLDLLKKNNVINIMGNSEEYVLLGGDPFNYFYHKNKDRYQEWTNKRLDDNDIEYIKSFKHSYELELGGKKIGLCHFVNDVRIDFTKYSTWGYQDSLKKNDGSAIKQFYYANSKEQLDLINSKKDSKDSKDLGFVSCYNDPILGGHTIDYFDEIFQGHVHFASVVSDENVVITTLRGCGIAYEDNPNDEAYYMILEELDNGYNKEDCYVKFNRAKMLDTIIKSDLTSKYDILRYVNGPKLYNRVLFKDSSYYKIGEVLVSNNWNPNGKDGQEMGGFNFSTIDKIFRWLIRGDTICDCFVPDDAELICVDEDKGVYRSNKIILYNAREVDDKEAMFIYKVSTLPDYAYYKALSGAAIRGYENTCFKLIEDKINKDNVVDCLKEIDDFVKPEGSSGLANNGVEVYNKVIKKLNEIKNN